MNFSPFFVDSGGLVKAEGLEISFFSEGGGAAHIMLKLKKSAVKKARRRIMTDLLECFCILPPYLSNFINF